MSAPASASSRTASPRLATAAHTTAVVSVRVSFALTSEPAARIALIAATLPVRAACISSVCPSGSPASASGTFAPAVSSARTAESWPARTASVSGVTP